MSNWKLNRLRVLRAEKRLTQIDVAQRLGMSQTKYWQIETGLREPEDAEERKKLARILGVRVSELMPDEAKAS